MEKWFFPRTIREKGMPFLLDNVDKSIGDDRIAIVWKRVCKKLRHEE